MPGRDDFRGYRSDWEDDDRRRQRERDRFRGGERRSFGRYDSDEARYATEDWRSERAGDRYDQDRAAYSSAGRPAWQDRDWEGGSPGLSGDERLYRGRAPRSFRQGRSEDYGYGGQEYGIEAGGGRGESEFGRSPEPVQRVTDAEEGRSWRDRFGDDGRPHPRFDDEDRERRFARHEDDRERRGGMFGGRDEREGWFSRRDDERERRFGGRGEDRGHMRWRDDGGAYGDTRMDREDRGMSAYGVPHDYGYHQSLDPFEAADSRRRQDEIRRRADEDRRRRADLERQEREYRSSQARWPWDR